MRTALKADGKGTDWLSALENALLFVFSYLRDMRNDAGHPTGVTLGRDVVLSHLVVFPSYVRVFYDLIEWLEAKKPV